MDHRVKDFNVFGTVTILDASTFEQHNVNIKQIYEETLIRVKICTNETVERSKRPLDKSKFLFRTPSSKIEKKIERVEKNNFY